jgi:hypothetical protein
MTSSLVLAQVQAEAVIPGVNQETLAKTVGMTRYRVGHFMNRFREYGFIDYDKGGLTPRM